MIDSFGDMGCTIFDIWSLENIKMIYYVIFIKIYNWILIVIQVKLLKGFMCISFDIDKISLFCLHSRYP